MRKTDMIIIREDFYKKVLIVEDRYSLGKSQPVLELEQNVLKISGDRKNGYVDILFTREINSKDSLYDTIFNKNLTKISFAKSKSNSFDDKHF